MSSQENKETGYCSTKDDIEVMSILYYVGEMDIMKLKRHVNYGKGFWKRWTTYKLCKVCSSLVRNKIISEIKIEYRKYEVACPELIRFNLTTHGYRMYDKEIEKTLMDIRKAMIENGWEDVPETAEGVSFMLERYFDK